mgnify:CR=1 FL=1
MRRIIFSLLVLFSVNAYPSEDEPLVTKISSLEVNAVFDSQRTATTDGLEDFIDREEKVGQCVDDYIKRQSKSYGKIVQHNLYDLIHNFDKITSKIYGKKQTGADIPYEEKIEILARIQCDVYHAIGTLK